VYSNRKLANEQFIIHFVFSLIYIISQILYWSNQRNPLITLISGSDKKRGRLMF